MSKWLMPWFASDDLDKWFDEPMMQTKLAGVNCPVVDVYEKENRVYIEFEVPGVDEKDLDVEIDEKGVMVKGEIKEKKEIKDKKYYRVESKMNSFSRYMMWPKKVDIKGATADLSDGVLIISAQTIKEEKLTTKLKVKKLTPKSGK